MTSIAKRIKVIPGTELDRLLDEAGERPLLLERTGVVYRLAPVLHDETRSEYDPEVVRRVLRTMAGSLPDDEADRMLADLYHRREAAASPAWDS